MFVAITAIPVAATAPSTAITHGECCAPRAGASPSSAPSLSAPSSSAAGSSASVVRRLARLQLAAAARPGRALTQRRRRHRRPRRRRRLPGQLARERAQPHGAALEAVHQRRQCRHNLVAAGVAILAPLGEHLHHHRVELGRHLLARADGGATAASRTSRSVLSSSPPENSRASVRHSCSTMPSANRSLRAIELLSFRLLGRQVATSCP